MRGVAPDRGALENWEARMKRRSSLLIAASLAAAALAASVHANPPAARAAQGEEWEVTSQMSMQGVSMPPQTHRSCNAAGSQEPAGTNAQPGCKPRDFRVIGNKTTWHVECAGPPKMSGTGEITRTSAEAYSGTIRFDSEEGPMTLKLNGRRVGPCLMGQ
jgi:hypothetical protein